MRRLRPTFRTGERILQSGIYEVTHRKHRVPHEVTLLIDEMFPRCAKCQDAVKFRLLRAIQIKTDVTTEQSARIHLYELPVFEEDQPVAV